MCSTPSALVLLVTISACSGGIVTYYSGKNFMGEQNTLDLEPSICYNLAHFDKKITSMNTRDQCIMLYAEKCCTGMAAVIRLGSVADGIKQCFAHSNLDLDCDFDNKISSLALCLE